MMTETVPAVWCTGCQTLAPELIATDVQGAYVCARCAPYVRLVLRTSAAARADRAAAFRTTARRVGKRRR